MTGNISSRLSKLFETGELKTGRKINDPYAFLNNKDLLFEGGHEAITDYGCCYYRDITFPLNHQHGDGILGDTLSCCGSDIVLPSQDYKMAELDPRNTFFLDIETTGLSGGTGTWAFLIGLGWFANNHFLLRQYFLRTPAEEKAIIDHFSAVVKKYPAIITFNGKIFDLPLLQTRQVLNGFERTEPLIHLDLLQCARNLWKKRLSSRSLRSIEESLLGLKRFDDIPGDEIPAVYFSYLRHGNTHLLKKVFHHNVLDILSLVTLFSRVADLSAGRITEHPAESLALGHLSMKNGQTENALQYLQKTLTSSSVHLVEEAILGLALHYKRCGNWNEAVSLWEKAIDNNQDCMNAYIELAKFYEHRKHDYLTALNLSKKALLIANRKYDGTKKGEMKSFALKHRLARLQRRMAKQLPYT